MKIATAIVTALLVALGVAMKWTSLLPVGAVPYVALAAGIGGALATNLLPPFVPALLPPQVLHVLARLFATATAMLGVMSPLLHTIPTLPPNATAWAGFAAALIGALGAAFSPRDTRASVVSVADAVVPDAQRAPTVPAATGDGK